MTISPDAAREAALATEFSAIWNQELEDANCAPRMNIGYDPEIVAGKAMQRAYELGKAAFLSKTLEGADERVAEMQKRNLALRDHFPRNTLSTLHAWANELYDDHSHMLALVTALSAKLKEVEGKLAGHVALGHVAAKALNLTTDELDAQKAAHAKMLRDEALVFRDKDTALGYALDSELRRLADKIEGGE